jgi:hypothetical protein
VHEHCSSQHGRKDVINKRLIIIEPFSTFRGVYDVLGPDRPLLEVKVCMLADKPIARATSITKSSFDEVVDSIVQSLSQTVVQLMRHRSLGTGVL